MVAWDAWISCRPLLPQVVVPCVSTYKLIKFHIHLRILWTHCLSGEDVPRHWLVRNIWLLTIISNTGVRIKKKALFRPGVNTGL